MLSESTSFAQLQQWAANRDKFVETVPASSWPRLAALQTGAETPSALRVTLRFRESPYGPELRGHVAGDLRLECQRCLRAVGHVVDLPLQLLCLFEEQELDALPAAEQRFDSIVVGGDGVRLVAVIEDEVLASLPLAPKHTDADVCGLVQHEAPLADETVRPFAGLAELMGSTEGKGSS